MLKRIDNGQAFSRFMELYRSHNEACPTVTVKRTFKDGSSIEFERKQGVIPESVKTTFYMVLQKYVQSYNSLVSIMPEDMYSLDNMPALLTSGPDMALVCDCSDRTVRNHLNRLKDLGVVTTKFRGRKHAFELFISTEMLFGNMKTENRESGQISPLTENIRKNFPVNNTHRELIEKEKGNADKSDVEYGESIHGETGRAVQAGKDSPGLQEGPTLEEGTEGGLAAGRAANVARTAQERQRRADELLNKRLARTPEGLHGKKLQLLLDFWLYAWKVIYPSRDFSLEDQEKAMFAIYRGVYSGFTAEKSDREWVDFQVYQLAKLDKAAKYYDYHPEAYCPDPFGRFVPGKGYFDPENTKGFAGVDAWMKKDQLNKAIGKADRQEKAEAKRKKCEELLRTARRDFEKLAANVKPRKEVDGKTQMALFQYYQVIFASHGKKWVQKFCDQYLAQQANGFEPPKYFRTKKLRQILGEDVKPAASKPTVIMVEDWMTDGDGYYVL